jgi:hypothetical protein
MNPPPVIINHLHNLAKPSGQGKSRCLLESDPSLAIHKKALTRPERFASMPVMETGLRKQSLL